MSDIPHPTQGATRDSQIYVSWRVRKALSYIPREQDESIDSIAEAVLKEWLEKNHQPILDHLNKQNDEDKAFRASLAKPIPFT